MERFGFRQGVWICNFTEFKALSTVFRHFLIVRSQDLRTHVHRNNTKDLLYDYFISTEFRNHWEGIVEGIVAMQTDLESEKRSEMLRWKKKEKQISRVLNNVSYFYGSIRGIAGDAIPKVDQLEVKQVEEDELLALDEPLEEKGKKKRKKKEKQIKETI